ncbi:protein EARLY FLOWERING 4 [Punica granatum]|uniref:Protein EARLY FLOWERING 4 n=2 Tax=Punica granatum TaxID=22663 RepID=A0A6P8BVA0_PUNGR|nr:protein EARLY FLOWERING 4 [Punica granatum]PKI46658.1 hypothetical protein CRG98_033000 [Punica granatum]
MDQSSGRRHRSSSKRNRNNPSTVTATTTTTTANSDDPDQCDPEVWDIFNSSFSQVQSVLDRNRVLIQQVNENHQSKIPDNMVKNVALIQEINQNISKVRHLYSDLSTTFSTACHEQRSGSQKGGSSPED